MYQNISKSGVVFFIISSFCAKSSFLEYQDFELKFVEKFIFGQARIRPPRRISQLLFVYILISIYRKFNFRFEPNKI